MARHARTYSLLPFIAISLFLLGLSFVLVRAQTPSDGARLGPGEEAWLPNGVQVSPLTEVAGGLQSGDLITAVEGKRMDEWAQPLVRFDFPHLTSSFGQTITYSVLRNGQTMEVQATQIAYPFGALLSRYWGIYVVVLSLQLIMTYVLIRRPEEEAARALFVFAWSFWHFPAWTMGLQVSDILSGWGYWHYHAVTFLLFLLTFSALLHTSLVFPRRHLILDRHPRLIPIIYLAPYCLFVVFMALAKLFSSNLWIWLGHWNSGEWAVTMIYMLLFIVVTIMNYRNVQDEPTRVKIRWVAFGWSVSAAGIVFLWLLPGALLGHSLIPAEALALLALPIPLALAIAILRHHLFDIDLIINRTLVYSVLTLSTMTVYIFIVGYLGGLFQASEKSILAFLATGLVAVTFNPLREWLQRRVNRVMYGERDDPYAVLSRLGQRLEATLAPEAVLPTIVETVAQALKLPCAAIALKEGEGFKIVAASPLTPALRATPPPSPGPKAQERGEGQGVGGEVLPLVYQGEIVGQLIFSPRAPGEAFSAAERRLLEDIAHQAGVAVHAVRLTVDLQRSRERIVTAREEERRHIRRELHDGLGPSLAGLTLKMDAARNLLTHNPRAADDLLADLKSQTQSSIDDIRRLAYSLRPPALDELGLLSAIQEFCAGQERIGLFVTVEFPENIPPLSAAVEAATYRIVCEALTNAARHARAGHCTVQIRVNKNLEVEICDDGQGVPEKFKAGVGLASMRERAAELGGQCRVESRPEGGTRVLAVIPIGTAN